MLLPEKSTIDDNKVLNCAPVERSVAFGIGAVTVSFIPRLSENAAILLPSVIAFSIVFAPIITWVIAPELSPVPWKLS